MRSLGIVGFAIVFVGFWSAITLVFDVIIARGVIQGTAARSWPSTTGTVTHSDLESHSDSDGTTYEVDIRYDYSVNGTAYSGDRYRFGSVATSSRKNEQAIVSQHPVGSGVTVHYDPDDPSQAVLVVGVQGQDLFLLLFMTPFNIVMLGGWVLCGEALIRNIRKPPAGGVPILRRGNTIRLRLPRYSPSIVGAGWALGLSFVSIFAVGIPFSFHPPMQLIVGVWALVAAVSIGVYLKRRLLAGSGVKDLVIDDGAGTITLPRTFGRKESISARIDAIRAVSVKTRVVHSTDSSTTYHEPTIKYLRDGTSEEAKIASWTDAERAGALASWIRDWLRLPA